MHGVSSYEAISEIASTTTSSVHPRDEDEDTKIEPSPWRIRRTGDFSGPKPTGSVLSSASASEGQHTGVTADQVVICESYPAATYDYQKEDVDDDIDDFSLSKMNVATSAPLCNATVVTTMHFEGDGIIDESDTVPTLPREEANFDMEPIPWGNHPLSSETFTGAVADARTVTLILNSLNNDDDEGIQYLHTTPPRPFGGHFLHRPPRNRKIREDDNTLHDVSFQPHECHHSIYRRYDYELLKTNPPRQQGLH